MMISSTKPSPVSRNCGRFISMGLILIGLLLVGLFGVRTVASYIRIQRTELQAGVTDVEAIRGWMTIPYIAKAYGVPEGYIFAQIGIPQVGNQAKSLSQLNRTYAPGQPAVILSRTKAALTQYQAAHPTPPGDKP
jgi:hypothetical protein